MCDRLSENVPSFSVYIMLVCDSVSVCIVRVYISRLTTHSFAGGILVLLDQRS
jgi:hypothetical protein